MDKELSEERIAQAVEVLKECGHGRWPLAIWEVIVANWPVAGIEMAIFRKTEAVLEVFLQTRPIDDPWWPGKLALPGVVLLRNDFEGDVQDPVKKARNRLEEEEMPGVRYLNGPYPSRTEPILTRRGPGVTLLYWATVSPGTEISGGSFYRPLDVLDDLVETQEKLIRYGWRSWREWTLNLRK